MRARLLRDSSVEHIRCRSLAFTINLAFHCVAHRKTTSSITTMPHSRALRLLATICLCFLVSLAAAQTTVVSITSTTTIHATTTDSSNACNNFAGACVVYGSPNGQGAAAYTTTVYSGNPTTSPTPTSLVTSTTVVLATKTVTDASACQNFDGSCVVYGSGGSGQYYTTTAYAATSSLGNSGGYIAAESNRDSPGYIGAASAMAGLSWVASLGVCVGWMLMVWI